MGSRTRWRWGILCCERTGGACTPPPLIDSNLVTPPLIDSYLTMGSRTRWPWGIPCCEMTGGACTPPRRCPADCMPGAGPSASAAPDWLTSWPADVHTSPSPGIYSNPGLAICKRKTMHINSFPLHWHCMKIIQPQIILFSQTFAIQWLNIQVARELKGLNMKYATEIWLGQTIQVLGRVFQC